MSRLFLLAIAVILALPLLVASPQASYAQEPQGRWIPYAVSWVKAGDEFVLATDEIYSASLPENLQSGQGVVFEIDGYTFTYKLSGGKVQWTDAAGSETKSIGAIKSSIGVESSKSVTYTEAFADTTVRYSAYSYGLKEEFILSVLPSNDGKIADSYLEYTGELTWDEDISVWVDGIEYPDKTFSTSSKIVFKDSAGKEIAWLPAPFAYDSSVDTQYCDAIYDVKVSAGKIQYGLRVPYSWLETATFPVTIDPGWTTPTGFEDPDTYWGDEAYTYDDNTSTYADTGYVLTADTWTSYLILTVSNIACDKVRFDAEMTGNPVTKEIDLDVYRDGSWVNVYEGSYDHHTWVEKTFTAGNVTKARMRFYHNWAEQTLEARVYEFDFYEVTVVAPTVTTQAAASVEETTATAHGTITDTGYENATTRGFKYGLTETDTWDVHEDGNFTAEAYSLGLTGLDPGTTYYVRAYATNPEGTSYGSYVSFTTKPDEPTGLATSNPIFDSLDLDWTKGDGATHTMIRRKTGSYPTDETDGTLAYYGTSNSATATGLEANTMHYFGAYSFTSPNYSDSSSQATGNTSELGTIPISFLAHPASSSQMNLTWEWYPEGNSSIQLGIYYALNNYPATRALGTLVYQGSGTSATHTGLPSGESIYYRGWPYDTEDKTYSSTYVQDWATTFGSAGPGDVEEPSQPSEWFQSPTCTAYASIPLLWDALEAVNTGYGTPLPTVCVGFTMLWISVLGLTTAIVLKSALLMIVVIAVLIIVCAIAGLLPLWTIAIALGMGGLSIYVWQRS